MKATHHDMRLSAEAVSLLAEEIADLLDNPPAALVASGVLVLGATQYRLSEATTVMGVEADPLVTALARGATVAINEIQRLGPHFAALSAALGDAAHNLNVYVTGPATPGAACHVDGHDVAALQLSGAKRWLCGEGTDEEFVLEPGHALLVPSGLPHGTVSIGAGVSMHVSINCAEQLRRNERYAQVLAEGLHRFELALLAPSPAAGP